MTTYYETLNVAPTATPEEIKKAYRKMAKKKHPDASGSKEEFQEISKAWMILRDPIKREHYDRTGSDEPNRFEEIFQSLIVEAFSRSDTPIQHLQDNLKRDAERLESARSKAKVEQKIFKGRIKRFSKNNPDADLVEVLQFKSDQMEKEIQDITSALDAVKKMQDRLKIYKEGKQSSHTKNREYIGPTTTDLEKMFTEIFTEMLKPR